MATKRSTAPGARSTPAARTRTIVAGAGLGLLLLAQAAPAGAAEPALRWTSAGDGYLAGTVSLQAEVATDQPVDGWSLSVLTAAQEPAFGVVCEKSFPRARSEFRVNCPWNTRRYPDQRPSANQRYVVRLMTHQGEASQPAGPDLEVALANPAFTPGDVALAYDEASGRAVLTWTANAEPDLIRYAVEEKIDAGPWQPGGQTTDTTFERTLTEPGRHRFRVAAERHGPDGQPIRGFWGSADDSSSRAVVPANSSRTAGSPPPPDPGDQSPPTQATGRGGPPAPSGSGPTPAPGEAESRSEAGPAPGTGTPPAAHASIGFSPSSSEALASLPTHAALTPLATSAPRPPQAEEPDPGYSETLPYPQHESEVLAAASGPDPDALDTLTATAATRTGRSGTRRRTLGFGLVAAAAVLLGAAASRPAYRRMRRPSPVATDDLVSLAELEDRVTRLEAHFAARRQADPGSTLWAGQRQWFGEVL